MQDRDHSQLALDPTKRQRIHSCLTLSPESNPVTMKHLTTVLLAVCFFIPLLSAELENDIPLGIEGVTGIRSDYVYRGFNLANVVMDFQVETEIVIGETLTLGAGGWLATEVSKDFTEGAGFLDLHYSLHENVTITTSTSYHAYHDSFFDNCF